MQQIALILASSLCKSDRSQFGMFGEGIPKQCWAGTAEVVLRELTKTSPRFKSLIIRASDSVKPAADN
jgi:hypothetical protein